MRVNQLGAAMDNKHQIKPEISVIIPVYNEEKHLRQCLNSAVNQTMRDIEIICVDDCSDDASLKILQDFAAKDERIIVICLKKHKQQGGARNAALDVAKGKYICFIDADDYVSPDYCEYLLKTMQTSGADVVIADIENYTLSDDKKLINLKNHFDKIYALCNQEQGLLPFSLNDGRILRTGAVAKLFKAEIINRFKMRFPENVIQEDEAFYWYYMSQVGKVYAADKKIYYRLVHDNSTMYNRNVNNQRQTDFLNVLADIYRFLKQNNLLAKYKQAYSAYFNRMVRGIVKNKNLSRAERFRIFCEVKFMRLKFGVSTKNIPPQKEAFCLCRMR